MPASSHRLLTVLVPSLLLAISLVIAGCDAAGAERDGDVVNGVDLDVLFAPATAGEIERATAAWEHRDIAAAGVEVVAEEELSHPFAPDWRAQVRIVRHQVGGFTHYGAVLVPSDDPDVTRSVLLYLHGGDGGVRLADVALAMAVLPEVRSDYIVVVPSFRSEPLVAASETYRSDGPPSPWDRDVDDTLALLNAALAITPAADGKRVAALGFSRGAGVGLLAAVRDPRIQGVVNFFGPTDFLAPFAREVARDMLRDRAPALPGIEFLDEALLQPLQNGELTVDDVRLDLIRRSAVYYADRLPAVQTHHGLADTIVPFEQGTALADALDAAGADHEAHFYPDGGHDPITLNGSLERVTTFLSRWTNPPG